MFYKSSAVNLAEASKEPQGLSDVHPSGKPSLSIDQLLDKLYKDGGAHPSLFFQQYPHGLGLSNSSDLSGKSVSRSTSSGFLNSPRFGADLLYTTATMKGRANEGHPSSASSSFLTSSRMHVGSTSLLIRNRDTTAADRTALVAVDPSTAWKPQSGSLSLSSSSPSYSTSTLETRRQEEQDTVRHTHAALQNALKGAVQEENQRRELLITGGVGGKGRKDGTSSSSALSLVIPEPSSRTEVELGGPIVRSPTKAKKSAIWEGALGNVTKRKANVTATTTRNGSSLANSGQEEEGQKSRVEEVIEAIPFCVSGWLNKKKLIVPIEQRIAQEVDERLTHQNTVGDHIIDLATAMRSAKKAVQEEVEEQQRAQQEAAERQQALVEAEEAEKGRKLLEAKAQLVAQQQQRKETRAERLERIRVEREIREREHQEYQRRRLRERVAARLQMTVEALEGDEELLQNVENNDAAHHCGIGGSGVMVGGGMSNSETGSSVWTGNGGEGISSTGNLSRHGQERMPTTVSGKGEEEEEDVDGDGNKRRRRVVHMKTSVFTGSNVSNEGIVREMEALKKQEMQEKANLSSSEGTSSEGQGSDGIRWKDPSLRNMETDDQEEDDDDEDDDELENLRKKRRLLL